MWPVFTKKEEKKKFQATLFTNFHPKGVHLDLLPDFRLLSPHPLPHSPSIGWKEPFSSGRVQYIQRALQNKALSSESATNSSLFVWFY